MTNQSSPRLLWPIDSLHTAAAPAVRAAVKTELSYRKDTIIAIFFRAIKNKDNARVALASSNSYSIFCSK